MSHSATQLILAALLFCVLSCHATMMVVFMAGIEAAPQIHPWLQFQLAMSIFAGIVLCVCLGNLRSRKPWRQGLADWWHVLPAWMLVAFAIVALLAVLGELSFALLYRLTGRTGPWPEHVPLISMTVCSLAALAMVCEARSRNTSRSGIHEITS